MKIRKTTLRVICIGLVLMVLLAFAGVALAWTENVEYDPSCEGVNVSANPEVHQESNKVKWVPVETTGTGFYAYEEDGCVRTRVDVKYEKYVRSCFLFVCGPWTATGHYSNGDGGITQKICRPATCTADACTNIPGYQPEVPIDKIETSPGYCEDIVPGCMTAGMFNYNPAANQDDGSCVAFCEYDQTIAANDPLCVPPPPPCEWNPQIPATDPLCVPPPEVCPYDPELTVDDPECVPPPVCEWNPELLADDPECVPPEVNKVPYCALNQKGDWKTIWLPEGEEAPSGAEAGVCETLCQRVVCVPKQREDGTWMMEDQIKTCSVIAQNGYEDAVNNGVPNVWDDWDCPVDAPVETPDTAVLDPLAIFAVVGFLGGAGSIGYRVAKRRRNKK